jgi:hypothetical protein
MNVDFRLNPFPHIFIDQFYDESRYNAVWREVMHLYPKMQPPNETGAARDSRGIPRKKGMGIFVDSVYTDRGFSDIITTNMQILSHNFKFKVEEFSNLPEAFYFKLYRLIDPIPRFGVLLQLYTNGDYYKPHEDTCVFTSVLVLNSPEKKYSGGELYFPEYDHTINVENNQMIIFPSIAQHEVKEVKMNSDNPEDGRFSISMLMFKSSSEHQG